MRSLPASDVSRLQVALDVLGQPLAYASSQAWRRAVVPAVRDLLGAQDVLFLLPVDGRPDGVSGAVDPAFLVAYGEYYHRFDRAAEIAARRGVQVASHEELYGHALYASEYFNDFMVPLGGARALGMTTEVEGAPFPALLVAYRDALARPTFEARERVLGKLLLPVFRGAVAADLRLRGIASSLAAVLDEADEALALVAADGSVRHVNPAWVRTLARDPEGDRVEAALGGFGRRLAAARCRGRPGAPARSLRARTRRGPYRLDATPLPGGAGGGPVTLVRLVRLFEVRLTDRELHERFALTPRQCQVAHRVADGASNEGVAAALGISVHTAKRHVEAVLRKLGVRARSEIRLRIVDG